MKLIYARDHGSWHVHLVPAEPADQVNPALCGLTPYQGPWPITGADELREWDLCANCARSARKRDLAFPPLPLFVNLDTQGKDIR